VPLSRLAVELLQGLPHDGGLVFPRAGHPDRQLHHAEPVKALRRLGHDASAHGFRSSFRDWAADRTSFPADVAEAALAHTIGDRVRRAYQRGDLFEQRRRLMEQWATFCISPPIESAGEVIIPLRAAASSAA
jgi:integrase